MRGTARTAVAAAVILLAAGCGTGHTPGPHRAGRLIAADGRTPVTRRAGTGQAGAGPATTGPPVVGTAQARRLVRALLARAQPPPGARPWPGRPPAALAHPTEIQGGSPSAGRYRLWRVAEPANAAYAFEARHVPPGMVWAGSGQGSDRGTVTELSVSFRASRLPAGVAAAGLAITVAPAGPGASVLRADAQLIWYPRRSAAEYVPAAVHAVTVSATAAGPHPHTVTKTTTTPSVVRQLAAMLNGVHAATGGYFASCPMYQASYRIAFAAWPRAAPHLVAKATTCPELQVTVGGHPQPALLVPAGLPAMLHHLTGVAAQPGRPGTARPLPPVSPQPWVSSVPRD